MRVPLPARGRGQLLDHAVRRRVLLRVLVRHPPALCRIVFCGADSWLAGGEGGSSPSPGADLEVPIHPVVRAFAMRLRARRWALARQST